MNQNPYYKNTILIFSLFFLIVGLIEARIHAPKGEESKIKLKIKEKKKTYYELDENGLNYKGVGKRYEVGDSMRIGIYSRSLKSQTGKRIRKYGYTVQIDNNKPQKLKYEKSGSKVTSIERPGWNYTQSGIWYIYLPVKEEGYKIKVKPLNGNNPVVYVRLSSKKLKRKGKFGKYLKTVNRKDRWRIETIKDDDINTTYWYPLKKDKQLQFEIKGPTAIRIRSRIEMETENQKDDYQIRIRENGFDLGTYYFSTEKSEISKVIKTGKTVSKWRSAWLNIPEDKHYYTFTLPNIEDNLEKTVYIRLKEWQEIK